MRTIMLFRHLLLLLLGLAIYLPIRAEQIAPEPPSNAELMLWVRAEELKDHVDGDKVIFWKDLAGKGNHFSAKEEQAPAYSSTAVAGKPGLLFNTDLKAEPRIINTISAPLGGEWRAMTMLVVGTNLTQTIWFGSAPGEQGELRFIGGLQHTGSNAVAGNIAKFGDEGKAQLFEITAGIDDDNFFRIKAYGNGKLLQSAESAFPIWGVLMRNSSIGSYQGWQNWQGAVSEIIIYKGTLNAEERASSERYLQVKYGLSPAAENDPKVPFGYAPAVVKIQPDVRVKPVTEGLRLWAQADDVIGEDQLPMKSWPVKVGEADIISEQGHAPIVLRSAINGHAALKFAGSNGPKEQPRTTHYIDLPTTGSWKEMTMVIAGTMLNRAGLFDTAPNNIQSLRHVGSIQHCSSRELSMSTPFPLMNSSGPMMGILKVAKLGENGQYFLSQTHGYPQNRVEVPDKITPLLFQHTTFGIINRGEVAFNGLISEIMIYDRALTPAECYQTENYLAEKYDLPLKPPAQIAREPRPRTSWSIRLPQLPREVSWIGNSESGKDSWIQGGIFNSIVMPDGTVASISVWDEGHKEIGLYRDGKSLPGKGLGGGGGALFYDGTYLYAGVTGMGKKLAGVQRLNLELKEEKWPEGRISIDTPKEWCEINGMARIGEELYVTCDAMDQVMVYDINTGKATRTIAMNSPRRLLAAKDKTLWIALPDGIAQYSSAGKATGKKIAGVSAGAIAFDNEGRLLVAENGERLQVIYYDITGAQPREVKTLGERGGIFAGPRIGETGEFRLHDPRGVGVDAAGNLYVQNIFVLASYTPEGKLRWQQTCTHFCQASAIDPASDGKDLYSRNVHYRYQAEKPAGKEWHWQGYTRDAKRFPEFSGGASTILRRFNGTLYSFTPGSGQVLIQRKEEGSEIFIPCGQVRFNETMTGASRPQAAPENVRYIWRDNNGNGLAEKEEIILSPEGGAKSEWSASLSVDSHGDIWEPQNRKGIRHIPLQGFTDSGAPIYDFKAETMVPKPVEFIAIRRADYDMERDIMMLVGSTWEEQGRDGEQWIAAGREMVIYNNWSKATRNVRCRIPFIATNISSYDAVLSRDLLFAAEVETAVVFCYDTSNGQLLGIVEPDPDIVGQVGWVDMPGGSVHAFERKNGEILLTVEESYLQKEMVYRFPTKFEDGFKVK